MCYALSGKIAASLTAILIIKTSVLAQIATEDTSTDQPSIYALSGDGAIAGGWSQDNGGTHHAEIWQNFNIVNFENLNNRLPAEIHALSANGRIAGGESQYQDSGNTVNRATIWAINKPNWKNKNVVKTDLGTLHKNTRGESAINALSDNGTIAGGWSDYKFTNGTSNGHHAAIWITKDKWQTRNFSHKNLGTLNNDNSGESAVNALSDNGSIAGGWADNNGKHHATIWTSNKNTWTHFSKQDLGTLNGDNSGESEVKALSGDGSIAGGWADSNTGPHATLWSGENWATKTDLGSGTVNALSGDGSIAGGRSDGNAGLHATLWSGENWSTRTDLGAGAVNALSGDGSIAGGTAINKNAEQRATLWRVEDSVEPTMLLSGTDSTLLVVARVDLLNTLDSVTKLARDSFATMEQQRLGLGRLQHCCDIARAGKSCYRLGGGASGFDGATDIYTGVSFGHAFSDNFASGITIANTFSGLGNLPGDLKRNGINPGVGLWAKWRKATQGGHWYLRGAAAANRAKIKRSRSGFNDIEPGTGMSTSTGWSVATELGRVHEITRKIDVGYYGGLRHSNVRLSGYSETRAPGFPFSWSGATSSRTAAYVGARYRMSFNKALYWSISGAHYRISFDKEAFSWAIRTELAHDLDHKDPVLTADADGGMHQAYKSDLAHTRGVLATEFSYAFNDAAVLSLSPFLEHSATDKTVYGAMLRLSGDF